MPDARADSLGALIRAGAAALGRSPTPMIDARALAKAAIGLDDAGLILNEALPLDAAAKARFLEMIARRQQDEPVAHIIGRREFWSLDIGVRPGLLVPRNDSETLIEAARHARAPGDALTILDLGCGTGALLCALLAEFPNATGLGVDIDPAAVETAAGNIVRFGFAPRARVIRSDWFAALAGTANSEPFDLIIANPPYIAAADRDSLPREVRDYESPRALFSGPDGLDDWRRILAAAPNWLEKDGVLIGEFGVGQQDKLKEIAFQSFPDAAVSVKDDLGGRPRAIVIERRLVASRGG